MAGIRQEFKVKASGGKKTRPPRAERGSGRNAGAGNKTLTGFPPATESQRRGEAASCADGNSLLGGQDGGSGQLRKSGNGWAARMGEAASCADGATVLARLQQS